MATIDKMCTYHIISAREIPRIAHWTPLALEFPGPLWFHKSRNVSRDESVYQKMVKLKILMADLDFVTFKSPSLTSFHEFAPDMFSQDSVKNSP